MRGISAIAGLTLLVCGPAFAAEATDARTPIDSWAQMRAALVGCWTVPAGTEGSVMAFRFLLAPNGGLRGPPRVMARILKGDEAARRAYEASAYAALDRCLPFALTPHFKAIMGETLVQLRFVNTPREPALNLGSAITIFAEEAQRP
ncbi:hypothetical protein [Methylobacterium goesingense]|uniref:Uncharacterized protein n=1 Tax=Methylobacterium goesingense TaxID=243690 RepID=A0ABV2L749_9HYPH|nr:hypothetical protein [Methylobacterium goesingense]GJD73705.1 hypothetical protein CFIICLFH_1935 [Methylobacterium goesingense]